MTKSSCKTGDMLLWLGGRQEEIQIPKDLKVLGYVTKDIAEFMTPSISYIEQHPAEVGAKAFELLDDRINVGLNIGKYEEPVIATTMVHLESTRFWNHLKVKFLAIL